MVKIKVNPVGRPYSKVVRIHRTYWVSEEEDAFIRIYLQSRRKKRRAKDDTARFEEKKEQILQKKEQLRKKRKKLLDAQQLMEMKKES